ncbi:ABC transporter substrate-binding protein [Glaciimonas sp. CA11.2]|uniref:ABC transporter substrate-binding protein n=1 Tax=unclassified Glaciimonas TaxID=2644401 RepID=UPI002AB47AF8|nr:MULTISPECIES: ABC transporter substrate-binding protein [unclassified Glaciimonas]MDY7547700.1 ABC transporter substrate-binding protein [Glaciimonas sp. CA11.2]MEB0012980.1 ABC transporter substrate-binding protein [Glaciimonas sp. Cout2]MEB0082936.1 ABC transporter substrate-binding protein [Glaciimonas sp. Gout2]MEB0161383.1 ABC transporter substrate-binding protein [Glaciimonas sp. CA11.2]
MKSKKNCWVRAVRCSVMMALFGLQGAPVTVSAGELEYGKIGEPVHLVIGYQPYYTESWSGVIMRGKKMYEKYLPKGSTVEFSVGLQGAVIVNAMLAGKQHIGYLGDMPAIITVTKQEVADIRIVATLGQGTDQCNIFLARVDAPNFGTQKEAIKWLGGKQVAVAKGSCADRFGQAVFKQENIEPAAYLNQNIEVITSGFRAGKLNAAVIWEPTASRLVQEGLAKRIASGNAIDEKDSAYLTMRYDLIKQRPDVVNGWLNAEFDAQMFLADPKNAQEVAQMAKEQTTGFSEKMLWSSMYGRYPDAVGGSPVRLTLPYAITPSIMTMINSSATFLYSAKSINVATLRPEAVMPQFADAVMKERGLTAPIGIVNALPESAYKGKP